VRDLADAFRFKIDPKARIENISVGQQQRVEILKALYRGADVLILDEPTAVLTPQEALELFGILRNLTREGMSVIFITHKLNEVLEIADRITVLLRVEKKPSEPGETLLTVDKVSVLDDRGLPAVRDVSLEVRAGEIVGLAGVDGNGQSELIDAITGLRSMHEGRVSVGGKDVENTSARKVLDAGLGHIPEDRQRRGLVLDFTLAENIALHDYKEAPDSRFGWLFPQRLIARARRLLKAFDVRGGGPTTLASALSGGNQQKVVVAREVERDPRVLLAAQPTRGLDVGAIEFVHRRLVEERDQGRAILLLSLELEEVLSLSDRILVMFEGEIVGEYTPDVTPEELGVAMTGGAREQAVA
jgi:simple sugar transport system ATP-binding protein